MRPIVPITTRPDVGETVEQHVAPGQIEAMRAIFEQLSHRVPNVSESDGEEYGANLCHSCEQRPMCEWTEPECEECYSEH